MRVAATLIWYAVAARAGTLPRQALPSHAFQHKAGASALRAAHVARAESDASNPLKIRPKIENVGKAEDLAKEGLASKKIGFRFDPALSKWIRDDKSGDKMENWEERGGAMNRSPLTGSSYMVWPVVYLTLLDKQLQSVTGDEALKMVKDQGALIVDVELEKYFKQQTLEGAVSVPLYQPVAGNAMMDNIKKIAMAAMAMEATERNPNFAEVALERLPKDKPIIVACSRGGSLESTVKKQKNGYVKEYEDPDRSFGIESRSLKACYELYEAGFTKVFVLKGGKNQWCHDGLPVGAGQMPAGVSLSSEAATGSLTSSTAVWTCLVAFSGVSLVALFVRSSRRVRVDDKPFLRMF